MSSLLVSSVLLLSTASSPAPPAEEMVPNARATFDQVSALIRDNYVDPKVGEEAIWSFAVQGLVDHLLKTSDKPVNELLAPKELAFLQEGIKGSISGVGLVLKDLEDQVLVGEVLPGGPASKTRMKARDRILAIDGKEINGVPLGEVAARIRGKEGSSVELLMQRGSEEWTETITRGRVEVESAQGVLKDGIAYVRLTTFNQDTPKRLDGVLAAMKKGGAKAMILDLRGSPGGLFDAALEVADRFLTTGEVIVSLKRRDGSEEIHRAKKPDSITMPIAILIGKETASSAEILAAALKENGRATLVGDKTFGKGTVEKIFELENGYALKLTIARFFSPKGHNWQGSGIEPDFVIPVDEKEGHGLGYSAKLALDVDDDPQLKAAFTLLRMGR